MFKKYLEYLKNNPNRYWFKRKIWGWGWVPATWQGWFVTVSYGALIFMLVRTREEAIPGNPDSGSNFLVFGLPFSVLTALFIFITYKKVEKPKWQWGLPKDNNTQIHLHYMEKLTFTIVINAPKEKVWRTMLEDATYREWTKPFNAGSRYEGVWETGSYMRFTGVDDTGKQSGGMYSKIREVRPYELVSIEHLGMITETGEIDTVSEEVKKWTPAFENYTFSDRDGCTEVYVELDAAHEWKDMLNDAWPKALGELKKIAEES